jgi:hypothetical protein
MQFAGHSALDVESIFSYTYLLDGLLLQGGVISIGKNQLLT